MRIKTPWGEYINLAPRAEAIWTVIEQGVGYALSHGVPPDPYQSEIAYRKEPMVGFRRRDNYQPWWEVLQQRHGDCEDLSMFLTAYLRGTGRDTDARVALIEWPSGGWHAVVMRPGSAPNRDETYNVSDLRVIYGAGTRIYGGPDIGWTPIGWYVEDPSRRLGMRDTNQGSAYSPQASLDQREPRGEAIAGRDPYIPFEIAGVPRGDVIRWRDVLEIFGR